MNPGAYVIFDGVHGCGKSSVLREMEQRLSKQGLKIMTVREPGQTPPGQDIRKLVLSNPWITPSAAFLMFFADRVQTWETVTIPALDRGFHVLSDRGVSSSLAYQIPKITDGSDRENLSWPAHCVQSGPFAFRNRRIHLLIVFDVDYDTAQERIRQRNAEEVDRFESMPREEFQKLRRLFAKGVPETMMRDFQTQHVIIDASRSFSVVCAQVYALLLSYLSDIQEGRTPTLPFQNTFPDRS